MFQHFSWNWWCKGILNPGTASHPNGVHSRSQQLLKNNETFSICVKFVTKRTTHVSLNLGKRCVNSSDVSQLSLLSVCEMDLLALCEVLANKQLGQREGKKMLPFMLRVFSCLHWNAGQQFEITGLRSHLDLKHLTSLSEVLQTSGSIDADD